MPGVRPPKAAQTGGRSDEGSQNPRRCTGHSHTAAATVVVVQASFLIPPPSTHGLSGDTVCSECECGRERDHLAGVRSERGRERDHPCGVQCCFIYNVILD